MEDIVTKIKKPSMELWFDFVESLICEYQLEDKLINDQLSQHLNLFQPPKNYLFERAALKLVSNKMTPFRPTSVLQNILIDLLNKKISFMDLSTITQKELDITKETADKISEKIKNNPLVLKEINEIGNKNILSDDEFENYSNDLFEEEVAPPKKQSLKGLNQDLL